MQLKRYFFIAFMLLFVVEAVVQAAPTAQENAQNLLNWLNNNPARTVRTVTTNKDNKLAVAAYNALDTIIKKMGDLSAVDVALDAYSKNVVSYKSAFNAVYADVSVQRDLYVAKGYTLTTLSGELQALDNFFTQVKNTGYLAAVDQLQSAVIGKKDVVVQGLADARAMNRPTASKVTTKTTNFYTNLQNSLVGAANVLTNVSKVGEVTYTVFVLQGKQLTGSSKTALFTVAVQDLVLNAALLKDLQDALVRYRELIAALPDLKKAQAEADVAAQKAAKEQEAQQKILAEQKVQRDANNKLKTNLVAAMDAVKATIATLQIHFANAGVADATESSRTAFAAALAQFAKNDLDSASLQDAQAAVQTVINMVVSMARAAQTSLQEKVLSAAVPVMPQGITTNTQQKIQTIIDDVTQAQSSITKAPLKAIDGAGLLGQLVGASDAVAVTTQVSAAFAPLVQSVSKVAESAVKVQPAIGAEYAALQQAIVVEQKKVASDALTDAQNKVTGALTQLNAPVADALKNYAKGFAAIAQLAATEKKAVDAENTRITGLLNTGKITEAQTALSGVQQGVQKIMTMADRAKAVAATMSGWQIDAAFSTMNDLKDIRVNVAPSIAQATTTRTALITAWNTKVSTAIAAADWDTQVTALVKQYDAIMSNLATVKNASPIPGCTDLEGAYSKTNTKQRAFTWSVFTSQFIDIKTQPAVPVIKNKSSLLTMLKTNQLKLSPSDVGVRYEPANKTRGQIVEDLLRSVCQVPKK